MKNILVVVLGVCLSVLCMKPTFAVPAVETMVGNEMEGVAVPEAVGFVETGMAEQEPRLTCALPGALGDAACTAHCKMMGYGSGYCDSKRVCNCRK